MTVPHLTWPILLITWLTGVIAILATGMFMAAILADDRPLRRILAIYTPILIPLLLGLVWSIGCWEGTPMIGRSVENAYSISLLSCTDGVESSQMLPATGEYVCSYRRDGRSMRGVLTVGRNTVTLRDSV